MEHLLRPGQRAPIRVPNYQQRPDVDGKIATVDDCARLFGAVIKQAKSFNVIEYKEVEALWVEYCHKGRVYNLCHGLLDQFYFGLLYQILGPDIVIADFTVRDDGGKVFLTTAKLERHLLAWRHRVSRLESGEAAQLSSRAGFLLHQASLVLRHLEWFLSRSYETVPVKQAYPKDEEPLGNTHFACVLIYQSLYHAWHTTFPGVEEDADYEFESCNHCPWLQKRLEREGWCPYTIEKLAVDARMMAYGYSFGTKRTYTADHENCSEATCIANNIDSLTVESPGGTNRAHSRHVTEKCECWTIEAPATEITEMLQRGQVPVLRIATDDGYKLSLHCREADPNGKGGRYVAFSHVWIDGLGSPSSNTIKQCQLTRIARHIGRLEATEQCGELGIWLDTLCIPTGSNNTQVRELGISQMYQVYKDAYAVIVMDEDLLGLEQRPSLEELGTRLYISAWSSRLWTYQEGALNDRLLVMMADSLVDVDKCMRESESTSSSTNNLMHELSEPTWNIINDMRGRKYSRPLLSAPDPAVAPETAFTFDKRARGMLNAIRNRTTSRPDDETVIVATYLNLPLTSMSLRHSDERMVALLKSMPSVLTDLVLADGARLQTPGFRWAPNTFLEAMGGGTQDAWDSTPGELGIDAMDDKYGNKPTQLDSQFRGLWMSCAAIQLPKTFMYHPQRNVAVFDLFGSKVQVLPAARKASPPLEPGFQTLVRLLKHGMREKKGMLILMPAMFSSDKPTCGVLVKIVGEADDAEHDSTLMLRYLMRVVIADANSTLLPGTHGMAKFIRKEGNDSKTHVAEWIESRYWLLD